MQFRPIKQFNTILQQEYLEPTISWSIRVVLALNVPLIVFPLFLGFSYHIIWAAFAAYMLTLIDYRGTHYKKMLIQGIEALLIIIASVIGMNIGNSIVLSVLGMLVIGVFAALIRNWSDYGSSIGVGVGFFYLFGISNPTTTFEESLSYAQYIIYGSLWAIAIIFISFPFSASNPLRRSIATIWKKNTEYLDAVIESFLDDHVDAEEWRVFTEKENNIRKAIDHSLDLFKRRKETSRLKASYYDKMMEIRRKSALFGASCRVIHENLEILKNNEDFQHNESTLYKTISALSQTSARLSIVIFTFRAEDLTMAKVRMKRFETAVNILEQDPAVKSLNDEEHISFQQLIHSLRLCFEYIANTLEEVEQEMNLKQQNYFENYKLSFNHFIKGLQPRFVFQIIREIFNVDSQQFNYSLRVGLGMAFSVFIFKFFQIDHGHWIALTMLIVIQPYYGATRKKGVERVLGTLAGIVVGGGIMLLPLSHNAFVVILIFISFLVAYFLRHNYKVGVFFVTIMMVVMMQLSQQGSWDLIWWRILSTIIGASLAIAISSAFWPVWEKQRFPTLLNKAFEMNGEYLKQVVLSMKTGLETPSNWHSFRRHSEAANHNLFASIQRMYEEPEAKKKDIDILFAKVGSNVRISREITSLAFQLEKIFKTSELLSLLQAFSNEVQAILKKFENGESTVDFQPLKTWANHPILNEDSDLKAIRTDLKKIIFELEALSSFRKVA